MPCIMYMYNICMGGKCVGGRSSIEHDKLLCPARVYQRPARLCRFIPARPIASLHKSPASRLPILAVRQASTITTTTTVHNNIVL